MEIKVDMSVVEMEQLLQTLELLTAWRVQHPRVIFLEPSRIASDPAIQHRLKELFDGLVRDEEMQRVFRVKHPDGYLLDGDYKSKDDVPERVLDRSCAYSLDSSECEIVEGYIDVI